MLRRLPSDAALLLLALAVIALTIGATLLLHSVFVGDGAHLDRPGIATAGDARSN